VKPLLPRALMLCVLFVVLTAAWQLLYLYAGDEALKSPLSTARYTSKLVSTGLFWDHLSETARAFAMALLIAVVTGLFLGLCGIGYLLMTAIGLHDVDLIMSLTLFLAILAVCASAVLLSIDRRLRGRM
jgi:ABC-type nitrate/sulfonate/bicarbonate transport system permease component